MASSVSARFKIWLFSTLGYWVIRAIGSTLRFEVQGIEHHAAIEAAGRRMIYVSWHGRILLATYFWRNRRIVVMTSQNRDGEYITRVLHRFGYGSARGSSSRGSKGALVEMLRWLRNGRDVGFTIDGPRGPRYIAKPGASWLSAKSGSPILPFNISTEKKWVLGSWDLFNIPKPFSRALVLIGSPIYVKTDAGEQELEAAQQELQRSLEDLLERTDSYWSTKK